MSRVHKDPLRELTGEERSRLEKISRSESERVDRVKHAKALLAVAEGYSYTQAAHMAGFKLDDSVSQLVSRFNNESLRALDRRRGGGRRPKYREEERARILQEVKRKPDVEKDGAATWSLTLLQRALRNAEDGLPEVSTYTILNTLHDAGYTWQKSRTWCSTGKVVRKRKEGLVEVTDPEADKKRE